MSFFSDQPWTEPTAFDTKMGPRVVRKLKLTNDNAGQWWKAWRWDKEAVKLARFACGKDDLGDGAWMVTHWQSEDGQFPGDIARLEEIIIEADGGEERAKEAQRIDFVAEDFAPLVTPQADKLFEWQRPSCQRVIAALRAGNALDASQTGAGKTFVALAAAAELGLTPYVVAPLAVLPSWQRAAQFMGVRLGAVINYDKARAGAAVFISKNKAAGNNDTMFTFTPPARRRDLFEDVATHSFVILDECQKCKNASSLQGRILTDLVGNGTKVLLLSATAAKDPTEMYGLGLALGLHTGGNDFFRWAKCHGCYSNNYGLKFTDKPQVAADCMQRIHRKIFPAKGTRVRAADVPGYPENQVSAHLVESAEIKKAYAKMEDELELIQEKASAGKIGGQVKAACDLAAVMRARRGSEHGKLDFMVEETQSLLAEGFQVAVFLNFREHLAIMRQELKLKAKPVWGTEWIGKRVDIGPDGLPKYVDIDGPAQKPHDRQRIIDDFQEGREKVILVSLQAGGAGINLHDERGLAARQSLISPSYSIIDLVQAVGRIWRAGGTKATQRIIFAAGTIEEEIAVNLESKCSNLERLNDGDLMSDSMARILAENNKQIAA